MNSAPDPSHARGVAPFGDVRIKACSRLPGPFRNVLRPSSPLSAKASTRCPSRYLITQGACRADVPRRGQSTPTARSPAAVPRPQNASPSPDNVRAQGQHRKRRHPRPARPRATSVTKPSSPCPTTSRNVRPAPLGPGALRHLSPPVGVRLPRLSLASLKVPMVEADGVEPTASCLQSTHSTT